MKYYHLNVQHLFIFYVCWRLECFSLFVCCLDKQMNLLENDFPCRKNNKALECNESHLTKPKFF